MGTWPSRPPTLEPKPLPVLRIATRERTALWVNAALRAARPVKERRPTADTRHVSVPDPEPDPVDEPFVDGRSGERGAGLVEYCLLVSLLVLAAVGGLSVFGGARNNLLDKSASSVVDSFNP